MRELGERGLAKRTMCGHLVTRPSEGSPFMMAYMMAMTCSRCCTMSEHVGNICYTRVEIDALQCVANTWHNYDSFGTYQHGLLHYALPFVAWRCGKV